MFSVQTISSFDAPELQPYATMRRPMDHEIQGIFVAEGTKVVERLLESSLTVVSVLLPEKCLETFRPLLEARPENFTVHLADKKVLESLIGFSMFQGVLAVGKIPPPISFEEMLANNASPKLFVAVDELSNAENLGALVRNCVAFGVQALIVGETSSSPYLRRAVRNSMGTIFKLPVIQSKNLAQSIADLRKLGIRCIAAHPHTDKMTLSQADFTNDCCIVFGSEGNGISEKVLEACDESVAIPMASNVDSLNVGAAGAVFLYEAARQRGRA